MMLELDNTLTSPPTMKEEPEMFSDPPVTETLPLTSKVDTVIVMANR